MERKTKVIKKRVTLYKVINGCNTSDETRYEIGDSYDPNDHDEQVTKALLEMNCLEEIKD